MSPIDTEAETNTRPKKLDLLDDDDSTTQDDDLEGNRSEHKHERGYYSRATPKNAPAPPSSTPLSEISKQFDRDGKGYLDDTEKQLRRMDTQNLGYLPVNKVYSIMEALQKEQKQSGKLLVALERQQKEAINLKKGVIGLAIFSVLLALSNIGTSFAAAKLAKDTTVSKRTGDLEDISTVSIALLHGADEVRFCRDQRSQSTTNLLFLHYRVNASVSPIKSMRSPCRQLHPNAVVTCK